MKLAALVAVLALSGCATAGGGESSLGTGGSGASGGGGQAGAAGAAGTGGGGGTAGTEPYNGALQTLAESQKQIDDVLADATNVYWTAGGATIFRVPLDQSTPPVPLFDASSSLLAMAMDADTLYFATQDSTVRAIPKAGGAPKYLCSVPIVGALVVHGGSLYAGSNTGVYSCPVGGGAAQQLSAAPFVFGLAADDQWVHFTIQGDTGGQLLKVGTTGGGPHLFGPDDVGTPTNLRVTPNGAFWIDLLPNRVLTAKAGSTQTTVVAEIATTGILYDIQVDGSSVYISADGGLYRASLDGGALTKLLEVGQVRSFALDDVSVIFGDQTSQKLQRIGK